ADSNNNIFGSHDGTYNLFEDVAGWGTARKIISGSQGQDGHLTVRRAWGRWERSTVTGPKMVDTLGYNNYPMTCENCIGTWNGEGMPDTYNLKDYSGNDIVPIQTFTNHRVQEPYGIFSNDGYYAGQSQNSYARILGSFAYVSFPDRYDPPYAVFI